MSGRPYMYGVELIYGDAVDLVLVDYGEYLLIKLTTTWVYSPHPRRTYQARHGRLFGEQFVMLSVGRLA